MIRTSDTSRVEMFSDGVMAIAITLLVLDIRLPETSGTADLLPQLLHLWPTYLAYLDSFLAIGVIWMCHHAFFGRLRRVDTLLRWANLALLLTVGFLPFPTAVLAKHMTDSGHNAKIAAAFYGLTAMAQAFAWVLMWLPVRRNPDLFELGYDGEFARRQSRLGTAGVAVFGCCALVSLLAPLVALVLYGVVILAYGLTADWTSRATQRIPA